jgi:lipopolysaccharide/colanic/teichoic acid biosynthesis glycosyltransferase
LKGATFQTLLDVQQSGITITRMPVAYEQLVNRVPINILEADWILRSFVDQFRTDRFFAFSKRLMDIIGGLVGVLILVIILPIVGLAVILDDGLPIFYSQIRLGRGGKPFRIIKFRTMLKNAEVGGELLLAKEDDERATRIGRILRKTHIDEIPQFINVLRGEMSLVGPRSERPGLVEHYHRRIPFYRARLLVKPGITGWAQVNFGYAGNVEETIIKLEYDLYYIKHRSMILDILTILRTPGTMLGMRGQ